MKRVLCNVVVDHLGDDDGGQNRGFRVTAVGSGEHTGITRSYILQEETEQDAAMEGIRRFVEEFSK